jgi:hypothetical protein
MGELIAFHYCRKCQKVTEYMFGASGTKGICLECNYESGDDYDREKDILRSSAEDL